MRHLCNVWNSSLAQNRESCYLLFVPRDVNTIDRSKISKILRAADQRSSDGNCSYGEASWSAETGAGKIRPAYRIDSQRHVLRCSLLYDRQGFCANPRDLPRGLAVSTSGEQSGGRCGTPAESTTDFGSVRCWRGSSPCRLSLSRLDLKRSLILGFFVRTKGNAVEILEESASYRFSRNVRLFLNELFKGKSSVFGFLVRMKINAEEILEELRKNLNYEET